MTNDLFKETIHAIILWNFTTREYCNSRFSRLEIIRDTLIPSYRYNLRFHTIHTGADEKVKNLKDLGLFV